MVTTTSAAPSVSSVHGSGYSPAMAMPTSDIPRVMKRWTPIGGWVSMPVNPARLAQHGRGGGNVYVDAGRRDFITRSASRDVRSVATEGVSTIAGVAYPLVGGWSLDGESNPGPHQYEDLTGVGLLGDKTGF